MDGCDWYALQPNLAAAGTGWLFRDAIIIYNV